METVKEYLFVIFLWMIKHYIISSIILFFLLFVIVLFFSFKNAPIMDDDYDI